MNSGEDSDDDSGEDRGEERGEERSSSEERSVAIAFRWDAAIFSMWRCFSLCRYAADFGLSIYYMYIIVELSINLGHALPYFNYCIALQIAELSSWRR